jgi:hypothetical protein
VQRLSIIVPLMGDLKGMEDTLVSVLENQPERSEVVVVLNQPYDDPYALRGEVRFVEAQPGADLAECFACGLAASNAEIVHVMASGYEATPGWADAALARFDEPSVAAVAPLVVDRDNPGLILSAGLSYSPGGRIDRIGAGRQRDGFAGGGALCGPELAAAFYRRNALEIVETVPHLRSPRAVGVGLALSMHKAGYASVLEPACVAMAAGELLASGSAWREGLACEQLFRRWSALPSGTRSWAAHAGLVAMECLQAFVRPSMVLRLAGRAAAMLGLGAPRSLPTSSSLPSSPSEAVIRPHHFGQADARPALHSRAAG